MRVGSWFEWWMAIVGSATAIKCICAYLIWENTLTIDKGIYHVAELKNQGTYGELLLGSNLIQFVNLALFL